MKWKILLVEDDPNLSEVINDYLVLSGYDVICMADGSAGLHAFINDTFDLCVLDVMLPKKDGFMLATEIRRISQSVPIIFLTALNSLDDRIKGYKSGCDDYIQKPFSSEELTLRINAIMRRCYSDKTNQDIFNIGKYLFDFKNKELLLGDKKQVLTQKEALLIRVLCRNMNQLVSREQALIEVWGSDNYFAGRSMDVYITKLRKHLKDDESVAILNVHGSGFKLAVKPD
jgi:two-component system, OmpR family, response regulator